MDPIFCCSLNSYWAPRYLTFSAESPKVPVPQCNCIGRTQYYAGMMGHCDPLLVQSQPGPHLQTNVSQRWVGVARAAKYRIHQDHWILKDLLVFRALRASVVPLSEKIFYFLKNVKISLVGESRGLRLLSCGGTHNTSGAPRTVDLKIQPWFCFGIAWFP